jgi:hypothetical protein
MCYYILYFSAEKMTALREIAIQFGEFYFTKRNKGEEDCGVTDLRNALSVAGNGQSRIQSCPNDDIFYRLCFKIHVRSYI